MGRTAKATAAPVAVCDGVARGEGGHVASALEAVVWSSYNGVWNNNIIADVMI